MTSQALTTIQDHEYVAMIERIATIGNLAELNAAERLWYYKAMCKQVDVDPVLRPFNYIETTFDGRRTVSLYPNAVLAAQLEGKHKLSIQLVDDRWDKERNLYGVKARATGPDGRFVEAWGWVGVRGKTDDYLANQLMRAETKAFRRSILKWCGLALPDETEMEDVPGARVVSVNADTGEIVEADVTTRPAPPALPSAPTLPAGSAVTGVPQKPQDFLSHVNQRVDVGYDNLPHLLNALRQEYGNERWNWPRLGDAAGWNDAYEKARASATARINELEATLDGLPALVEAVK